MYLVGVNAEGGRYFEHGKTEFEKESEALKHMEKLAGNYKGQTAVITIHKNNNIIPYGVHDLVIEKHAPHIKDRLFLTYKQRYRKSA